MVLRKFLFFSFGSVNVVPHPTQIQTNMALPTRPYAFFGIPQLAGQGTQNTGTKRALQKVKYQRTADKPWLTSYYHLFLDIPPTTQYLGNRNL